MRKRWIWTADEAKSWTESAFNIAKIAALLVVAFWTLFQWNTVIFPKESADQYARRVSNRTDLEFTGDGIHFSYLTPPRSRRLNTRRAPQANEDDEKPAPSRLYVFGTITVNNQKSFPIELAINRIEIRFGRLIQDRAEPNSATSTTPVSIEWTDVHQLNLAAAQGVATAIIESKASVSIPVSKVFNVQTDNDQFLPVELELKATATAVNAETGDRVPSSRKDKIYKVSFILDQENMDDPIMGSKHGAVGGIIKH